MRLQAEEVARNEYQQRLDTQAPSLSPYKQISAPSQSANSGGKYYQQSHSMKDYSKDTNVNGWQTKNIHGVNDI